MSFIANYADIKNDMRKAFSLSNKGGQRNMIVNKNQKQMVRGEANQAERPGDETRVRKYRIPERLASKLWRFEETDLEPVDRTIHRWMQNDIPDKRLIVDLQWLLEWVREFKGSVIRGPLGEAIHDSHMGDVVWAEPGPRPRGPK